VISWIVILFWNRGTFEWCNIFLELELEVILTVHMPYSKAKTFNVQAYLFKYNNYYPYLKIVFHKF
jgi:hypothetical protein